MNLKFNQLKNRYEWWELSCLPYGKNDNEMLISLQLIFADSSEDEKTSWSCTIGNRKSFSQKVQDYSTKQCQMAFTCSAWQKETSEQYLKFVQS